MSLWTDTEAVTATKGRSTARWEADGVSIDTRTLKAGDLFVALKDQRDGHDFVAQALSKGAAAALVSRVPDDCPPDAPLLIVPDVLEALEGLAKAARARTRAKVIAVTGSVGKTGTKEMLRCALAGQGKVHAAEKSYNNHWGVPLTLARMSADTDYAVIEIGMNHPGEIAPLAKLAAPHVAIITTVAPVHMAAFRDVRQIAREKAAIFEGLAKGGTAIINRDQPHYATALYQAKKHGARIIRFGATGRPEYQLLKAVLGPETTTVQARVFDETLIFKIGAPGRHLAMNALAVIAAATAAGADLVKSAMALADWHSPEGRGAAWQISRGIEGIDGNFTLIDESYNANPLSMRAALEVLAAAKPKDGIGRVTKGRRIAILGDMLELGPDEMRMHADIAAFESMAALDIVHCVGPRMRALYDALPSAKRGRCVETAAEIAQCIGRLLDDGDVVMVKGSNGSRVGIVVDAIKKLGQCRPVAQMDGDM